MAEWNFADIFETVADHAPDREAQVQGDRRLTWGDTDRRADGVARALLAGGAGHQDKVALYLYNGPEYLEGCFAAWKAGLVPINTNYRYTADELVYLWDNADVIAVIFHATFSDTIEPIRDQLPEITTWLWVDDGAGPCPAWATPYEDAAESTGDPVRTGQPRSGDDLLMLYTGGTTGMPKGVMWRQHDLIQGVVGATNPTFAVDEPDLAAVRDDLPLGGPLLVLEGHCDCGSPHLDSRAVHEIAVAYRYAIDEHAIGAVGVQDPVPGFVASDPKMKPRHHRVGDDEPVGRVRSD